MICTEEEAKTKACCGPLGCGLLGEPPLRQTNRPPQRPGDYHGAPFSDQQQFTVDLAALLRSPRTCIGSACMAWRWFDIINDDGELVLVDKRYSEGGYSGEIVPELSKRRGCCGLAERAP